MELIIECLEHASPATAAVEIAERKGVGHPDSICDGIAEQVCVRLCQYYQERFGIILHHNVDKVMLCAGTSQPAFGGGETREPIEIYLGGRAAAEHAGVHIPVQEIAEAACREWLRTHLPHLDLDRGVRIVPRLRPGSRDLNWLFAHSASGTPLANDSSCGTGFAPLTELESAVLAAERTLNAAHTKQAHPAFGEDVKVMGVRHAERIELTVSCAFVDRFLTNMDDYLEAKRSAAALAVAAASRASTREVQAVVNAADDIERGDIFMTVTGTSAEAGDDGQTGRGNRVCGLITPYRIMSIEGAAGKNPVSHTGKLYNLLALRIAAACAAHLPAVNAAACLMVSRIGQPLDDPQLVQITLGGASPAQALQQQTAELLHAQLHELRSLREALLGEQLSLY
jgi:S-adenosylmethionine synthetase